MLAASGAAIAGVRELAAQPAGRPPVVVREATGSIEMDDGSVKAKFTKTPHGVEQEYFAFHSSKWVRLVTALRPPTPRPENTAPLYADRDVALDYRLLVADSLQSVRVGVNQPDHVSVVLSGKAGKNTVEQTVSLASGSGYFHVEIKAVLAENPPKLEYLISSFVFEGEKPDYTHVPCMKREPADVIADRVFHSPAAILQKGGWFAALAPDLEIINADVVYAPEARPIDGPRGFRIRQDPKTISMPTVLDLDLESGLAPLPVFSFGFADYLTQQHMYWKHESRNGAMVRSLSTNKLHYGFDLFISATAPKDRGYDQVSRHMWKRYGTRYLRQPKPQALPFADYAAVCYPAAFAYKGDAPQDTKRYSERKGYDPTDSGPLPTWLEFEIGGKPAGGIRATPSQWYNDIQFMAWWNNIHMALGMYFWGKKLRDDAYLAKCRRILNLALAAPQNQGLFPAVYNFKEKRWVGCYWKPAPPYDPSVLPKYWDFQSDYYQTASASKTAALLLRYAKSCENDPRIIPYVRKYADFIVEHVDANGCLPAWFTTSLEPVAHLRFNAEGGVHIWFLSELHRVTGEEKYRTTAAKMATLLTREILPQQRWYDFETFYSCASKPESTFDARTGQWPRCTLSMIWAVDGLTSLYETTRRKEDLAAAEAVADYTALYQTVWQPHFLITAYAFGGCISQNSDAEWLDMRQCLLGEAYVRLGLVSGRQDMLERGVAALRSAFSVINHPAHIANGIFPTPSYPLGITAENIDHEGLPQLPLRSGSDWGEGGALSAAAQVMSLLGGGHVDFGRKLAVGVDGITITGYSVSGHDISVQIQNQLGALRVPYRKPYPISLSLAGLPAGRYSLSVNNGRSTFVEVPGRVEIEILV